MNKNKDYATYIRKKIKSHDLIMVPSAAIVPVKDNKIMLQLRSDTKQWGVFGGGIEIGEEIKDTARRELMEESGFETDELILMGIYSNYEIKFANQDLVNGFTIAFICKLKNDKNFKNKDHETLAVKWFAESDLEKIKFWNYKSKEIALDAFKFMIEKEVLIK